MKCKFCDGSGKDYWCLNGVPYPCPICNGTGEIKDEPLTNDEWRRTCSTEEFADFLMRVLKNCAWCLDGGSPQECPFNEFLDCPAESKENMEKWLKEKCDGE